MEDGLRERLLWQVGLTFGVLILVLMEDGLRVKKILRLMNILSVVLILVLMEDGLRDSVIVAEELDGGGLNPCFNGRWSASNKRF